MSQKEYQSHQDGDSWPSLENTVHCLSCFEHTEMQFSQFLKKLRLRIPENILEKQIFFHYAWDENIENLHATQAFLDRMHADLTKIGFTKIYFDIRRAANQLPIIRELKDQILTSYYFILAGTEAYRRRTMDEKTFVAQELLAIFGRREEATLTPIFHQGSDVYEAFPDILHELVRRNPPSDFRYSYYHGFIKMIGDILGEKDFTRRLAENVLKNKIPLHPRHVWDTRELIIPKIEKPLALRQPSVKRLFSLFRKLLKEINPCNKTVFIHYLNGDEFYFQQLTRVIMALKKDLAILGCTIHSSKPGLSWEEREELIMTSDVIIYCSTPENLKAIKKVENERTPAEVIASTEYHFICSRIEAGVMIFPLLIVDSGKLTSKSFSECFNHQTIGAFLVRPIYDINSYISAWTNPKGPIGILFQLKSPCEATADLYFKLLTCYRASYIPEPLSKKCFPGFHKILQQLTLKLHREFYPNNVVCVNGHPGIGKGSLVRQAIQQWQDEYQLIRWISSCQELKALLRDLGMHFFPPLYREDQVNFTYQHAQIIKELFNYLANITHLLCFKMPLPEPIFSFILELWGSLPRQTNQHVIVISNSQGPRLFSIKIPIPHQLPLEIKTQKRWIDMVVWLSQSARMQHFFFKLMLISCTDQAFPLPFFVCDQKGKIDQEMRAAFYDSIRLQIIQSKQSLIYIHPKIFEILILIFKDLKFAPSELRSMVKTLFFVACRHNQLPYKTLTARLFQQTTTFFAIKSQLNLSISSQSKEEERLSKILNAIYI